MENHGILNWRKWSWKRKGLVIGGLIGVLSTLCIQSLALVTLNWPAGGVSEALAFLVGLLWIGVIGPTALVYHALHWEWRVGRATDISLGTLCLITILNALIFGAVVAGILYLWEFLAKCRAKQ